MLLEVSNLKTEFKVKRGIVKAVNDVSFEVDKGEILAIVGESGSGKSVASLSVMGLIREPGRVAGGRILFNGDDMSQKTPKQMREIRGNKISMIFQEPMTSLNPVQRIGDQLCESILTHTEMTKKEALEHAVNMLRLVGIPSPEQRVKDYPHQMSGGMRQRVMIAMALCCDPELLIADEPVSALDVSIQAQVLNLLDDLKEEFGLTYLFIAHGLNVVKHISDRVGVMYLGKIMELADKNDLYENPLNPYTQALLSAIPSVDIENKSERIILEGDVPTPIDPPNGCRFCSRCFKRTDGCDKYETVLKDIGGGHFVGCRLF